RRRCRFESERSHLRGIRESVRHQRRVSQADPDAARPPGPGDGTRWPDPPRERGAGGRVAYIGMGGPGRHGGTLGVTKHPHSGGLRSVALFEGTKGALVLAAGCGLLGLVHRDVQGLAEEIVRHSHLNPASRYPRILLEAASKLTDANLWL